MAERKVGIEYQTTGAGKAADEAAKVAGEIEKVGDAAESASQSTEQQNKANEQAAESLKRVETAAKAVIAARLADDLKRGVEQLRKFAEEAEAAGGSADELQQALVALSPALDAIDAGLDGVSAGFQAAAATGNPLIGLFVGIVAEAGNLVPAFQAMRSAQEGLARASKDNAEAYEFMRQAQQKLRQQIVTDSFADDLERETLLLERNLQLLEREQTLRNARTAADRATAALSGLPPGIEISQALADEVQRANDRVNQARVQATGTDRILSSAENARSDSFQFGEGSRQFIAADKAFQEAQRNAETAGEELTAALNLRDQILRKALAEASLAIQSDAEESATELRQIVEQAIAAGQASGANQGTLDLLRQFITDRVPDEDQAGLIRGQLQILLANTKTANAATRETLGQINSSFETVVADLATIRRDFADLQSELARVSNRGQSTR